MNRTHLTSWLKSHLYLIILAAAAITPPPAMSQIYTFEAYEKEIDRASKTSKLPEFGEFGDYIDTFTGSVTFRKTVVAIEGNNDLRVAADYIIKMQTKPGGVPDFVMERDLGYLEGSHSSEYGWIAGYAPTNYNRNRCSDPRALSATQGAATIRILKPLDNIVPGDYWGGNTLYIPDHKGGYIRPISADEPRPTGLDVKWATNSGWRFTCYLLPDGSEGFVGHRPNGHKYYFGVPIAQSVNAQIISPNRPDVDGWLDVDKFRMYVTRIEDQFGNWVNYSNNQISSSDGRSISFASNSSQMATIQSSGRQWVIAGSLMSPDNVSITNPDGSTWRFIHTGSFGRIESNMLNSCSTQQSIPSLFTGQITALITTESGATGTFTFQPRRRGFSFVNFECNFALAGHKEGQSYSKNTHFTDDVSLVSRTVSGPGFAPYTYTLDYGPVNACYAANGNALNPEPCHANSPATRTTTLTGPDGATTKFTYGNKENVNAGLLLSESKPGLEETSSEYVTLYENSGGAGMTPLGFDLSSYKVIQISKKVKLQNQVSFTTEVLSNCGSGSDPCFDEHFRPTRIVNSSSPQF